jgi:hypothetical protein
MILNKFKYQITYINGKKSKWSEWNDIEGCFDEAKFCTGGNDSKKIKQVVIKRIKRQ